VNKSKPTIEIPRAVLRTWLKRNCLPNNENCIHLTCTLYGVCYEATKKDANWALGSGGGLRSGGGQ